MILSRQIARIGTQIRKILQEATLTDWIMAFSTVCILIVAVIAACISYYQWRELHAGGVDTHDLAQAAKAQADATKAEADSMRDLAARALRQAESTDKLVEQTEKSANAALKSAQDADISASATKRMAAISAESLENARQNAHLDQRAWLAVTSLKLTKFQANTKLEAQLVFLNSGRSPALNVSVVSAANVFDAKEEPYMLPIAPLSEFTALRAIPPQGTIMWTKDSDKVLGTEDKERIEQFNRTVWVFGFVRYDDVFGKTHVTQFCGYTRNDGIVSGKISEGMDLYLCQKQNNGMD